MWGNQGPGPRSFRGDRQHKLPAPVRGYQGPGPRSLRGRGRSRRQAVIGEASGVQEQASGLLIFGELLRDVWLLEFNYGLLYAVLPGFVVSLVLAPLLVAGLAALVLMVLDGAPSRRKFGPVFRALGYSTAIGAVLWIPYAPLVALPYGLYVATVAVKEMLFLTWKRAAVSTLLPLAAVLLIMLLLSGPDGAYRLLINPPGE